QSECSRRVGAESTCTREQKLAILKEKWSAPARSNRWSRIDSSPSQKRGVEIISDGCPKFDALTHKIFNNHRRSARAGVHIRNHLQYTHDDSSRVSSDILDP